MRRPVSQAARLKLCENVVAHRLGEPSADAAAIDELAVFVRAKDQRGHTSAAVTWPVAPDYKFLSFDALYLEPAGIPVAGVSTVRALGDDALVPAGTHRFEDLLPWSTIWEENCKLSLVALAK